MALTKVSRGLLSTGIVDNSTTTAITIDSSENVGIGRTAIDERVHIQDGNNEIRFKASNASGGYATFGLDSAATSDGRITWTNALIFGDSGAERMRVSNGSLLVGKTAADSIGTDGIELDGANDRLMITRNNSEPLVLNRRSSDGDIAIFRKDGTTVGSIGSEGGNSLYIGNGDANLRFSGGSNAIIPAGVAGASSDGLLDLGLGSLRFRDLYRSGSTISTSDRNMKQDIRDLTDAERNVAVAAKGLLKAFRFIDRVEEEGDSANIHFGIIAQDLAAAFTAEGLDANDYQVYRADTFTDDDGNEQTRLGICYENLLAFIISAI